MEGNAQSLERLFRFTESFNHLFRRPGQVRWLALYLWGLLETSGRRNVESIARVLVESAVSCGSAPGQALQHLLSRSEWDENNLLKELRLRQRRIGEEESVWVIHDAVFLKRGKHSVGVHRQFLRDRGVKANCQTAVMISQVGASGYVPLALRLYLPRGWLEAADARQLADIPDNLRVSFARDEIARQMLEALAKEGNKLPRYLIAANGYASSIDLEDTANSLGLIVTRDEASVRKAEMGHDWLKRRLGLHHYEGRSWRGWHRHVAAVLLLFGYLLVDEPGRLRDIGLCESGTLS
jgi:SRSO17 transposase